MAATMAARERKESADGVSSQRCTSEMTRQEINLRYFTAQPRNKPAACDSGRGAFGVDSRIGGINEVAEVSANAPCCFSEVRAFFGHAREDTENEEE